ALALERPVGRALDGLAHLIHLDRAGVARFDNQHVGMHTARDAPTGGTLAARGDAAVLPRLRPLAVERLRERDGGRGLSHTLGARENQAGGQRAACNGARQQLEDGPVARDFTKGHRRAPAMVSPYPPPSGFLSLGFFSSFESSLPPKMRDQKPRFFFFGSS